MAAGCTITTTTTPAASHPSGNYQYTLLPVSEEAAAEPTPSATAWTKARTKRRSSGGHIADSGGSSGGAAAGRSGIGSSAGSYQRVIACLILVFVCMQFLLSLSSSSSSSSSASSTGSISTFSSGGGPPFHRKLWSEDPDGERRISGVSRGALSRPDYQYPAAVDPAAVSASAADNSSSTLPKSSNTSHNAILPLRPCPPIPPALVGRVKVLLQAPPMPQLEQQLPHIEAGGHYRPHECRARDRVAIIVPYRDRDQHLRSFLLNLHPILSRQQVDYAIFVIEQVPGQPFNRAKLMNVGFAEAVKSYDFSCFIFHDVDLLPEDDRNLYTCPDQPRHMSVAVNTMHYKLPYREIFGGVSALTRDQMEKVNGFSNEYWGWGGEDDDMANRVKFHGLRITRYRGQIARYTMMQHKKDAPNPDRYKKLYKGRQRFRTDGLSNLKYTILKWELRKLYTWVLVDLMYHKE